MDEAGRDSPISNAEITGATQRLIVRSLERRSQQDRKSLKSIFGDEAEFFQREVQVEIEEGKPPVGFEILTALLPLKEDSQDLAISVGHPVERLKLAIINRIADPEKLTEKYGSPVGERGTEGEGNQLTGDQKAEAVGSLMSKIGNSHVVVGCCWDSDGKMAPLQEGQSGICLTQVRREDAEKYVKEKTLEFLETRVNILWGSGDKTQLWAVTRPYGRFENSSTG
ncbi:MAG TPA: hypothetical protein VMX77_01405 [Candidatus Bathyarchaeia archaeon]|nr:hypothetical protein [Candidatus Bathyarchaeia archaeon]